MPIAYVGTGTAVNEVAGTTWAINVQLFEPATHIISLITDNISITGGVTNTHLSIVAVDRFDGQPIKLYEWTNTNGVVADGTTTSWWYLPTITGNSGFTNLNVTFSASVTDKIISFVGISCADGKKIEIEKATVSDNSATATLSGLASRQYFLLGVFSAEGEDTAKTTDPDYIEIFDLVSSTAGAASGNMQAHGQYRIATLTGDTVVSSDVVFTNGFQCLIALFESDGPTTALTGPANGATNQSLTPTLSFTPTLSSPLESGLNSALLIARGDITSPLSLRNSSSAFSSTAVETVFDGSTMFAIGSSSCSRYTVSASSFTLVSNPTVPTSRSNFFGYCRLSGTLAGGNFRVVHVNPRSGTTLATIGTYQFNGTNFVQVGNLLNIGTTTTYNDVRVARLSDTRVAVIANRSASNSQILTYDFDGTNWTSVGFPYPIGLLGGFSITGLSSTSVAVVDSYSWALMSYSFNGSTWSEQSIRQPISQTLLTIALRGADVRFMSDNRVAVGNSADGRLDVWRLVNNRHWALESRVTGISTTSTTSVSLGVINETDVIYHNSTINLFRAYIAQQVVVSAEADNGGGFSTTAPLTSGTSYNYNVGTGALQASTQYFWTLLTYGFTDVNWGTHAVGNFATSRSFTTLTQGPDSLTVVVAMPNATVSTSDIVVATPLTASYAMPDATVVIAVNDTVLADSLTGVIAIQNVTVAVQIGALVSATSLTASLSLQNATVSASDIALATSLASILAIPNVTIVAVKSNTFVADPLTLTGAIQNVTVVNGLGDTVAVDSLASVFAINTHTVLAVKNVVFSATSLSTVLAIQNPVISTVGNVLVSTTPVTASLAFQNVAVSGKGNVSATSLNTLVAIVSPSVLPVKNVAFSANSLEIFDELNNVTVATTSSVAVLASELVYDTHLEDVAVEFNGNMNVPVIEFFMTLAMPVASVLAIKNISLPVQSLSLVGQLQNVTVATVVDVVASATPIPVLVGSPNVTVQAIKNVSASVGALEVLLVAQVATVSTADEANVAVAQIPITVLIPISTVSISTAFNATPLNFAISLPEAKVSKVVEVQVGSLEFNQTLLDVVISSSSQVQVNTLNSALFLNDVDVDFDTLIFATAIGLSYSLLPVGINRVYTELGVYRSAIRNVSAESRIRDLSKESQIMDISKESQIRDVNSKSKINFDIRNN